MSVGLTLFAYTAFAQADTFTQVGTWSCLTDVVSAPPPPGPFTCPTISFPQPFGGMPNVIVSACGNYGAGCSNPSVSVTPQGFAASVLRGSKRITYNGVWTAVGPRPLIAGTVNPSYVVLTVVYAPPGTNGGKSSSTVSYGSGSTTGSTTSVSNSFKQAYSIAADTGAGFIGNGGGVGLSFTYGVNASDGEALDIKKSSNTTITRPGPSVDGIDHDRDTIYLWLNPVVSLSLNSSSAVWTFNGSGTADIQYVYVGWLRNPSCSQDATHPECMPDNMRSKLKAYGINEADFPDILAHDAFASGPTTPDPARYQALNFTFPYEPPFSATDPVPTTTFNVSNSSTATTNSSTTDDYKVDLTIHQEGNYLGLVKESMKTTGSWEWSSTATKSSSTGTTDSASVTVGGPAFGYTGSTDIEIYFDKIYKTFVFAPYVGPAASLKGTFLDANGKPQVLSAVSIISNGVEHHTLTNTRGDWKVFGKINGACKFVVGTLVKAISDCSTTGNMIIKASDLEPLR